ncbi:MAG: ATP-binding cassette domain-containing protein [Actinomycetota bacterium]
MNNAYELRGVEQRYGDRTVVDVPQLTVHSGEILGVVGPSGAGKSTLLRLLNFLEHPTKGRITYRGEEIGPDAPLALRRDVTTVFQRPMLLRRSVAANVRFGQKMRGETDESRVQRCIERLGLAGLADEPARTLSVGEAQRAALARALVVRPSVLLLDEPTGNLDPYNTGLLEEIVKEENAERGTTIVLVTHDVFQARRIAHRTALMISGRIVELAETEAFYENPKVATTAAFLRGDLVL